MKELESLIKAWTDATSAGNTDEANVKAMEVLCFAAEEALKNPTPLLRLQQEADELESQGNWTDAEAVRRNILTLQQTSENPAILAKAQMDLCGLLRLLNRPEEAARFASAATCAVRPLDIFPLLVLALECESWCALKQGDCSRALALTSEAVGLIEPGKLHDTMRARALTHRARCLVACGDMPGAESDLAASWELIQAGAATPMLPGPIAILANWWEVKGQIEQRQARLASAQVALMRSVEYRRKLENPHASVALVRTLFLLSEVSRAAGDSEAADKALNEARSIRNSLHLPFEDPTGASLHSSDAN